MSKRGKTGEDIKQTRKSKIGPDNPVYYYSRGLSVPKVSLSSMITELGYNPEVIIDILSPMLQDIREERK